MPRFFIFSVFFFFVLGLANLRFAPFCLSSLLANSLFFKPNYALLAPKTPLFNSYFAFLNHAFHGSTWFCLYNCSGYLCFSPCISPHLALRLAAKYLAFCTKIPCVLHQNTLRFAAKRIAFSTKTHCV